MFNSNHAPKRATLKEFLLQTALNHDTVLCDFLNISISQLEIIDFSEMNRAITQRLIFRVETEQVVG